MIARDIITEVGEVTGLCDQTVLLRRINRAVELLAAKELFDPLIGYLNFTTSGGNYVALPREVRTVLTVNIDGNPSIARSRLYEFDLNTNGTVLGDELDFQWMDRCNVCIQDEKKLPGRLSYRCLNSADNGKTITLTGKDVNGRDFTEVLIANTSPVQSANSFYQVLHVRRDETNGECLLTTSGQTVAQYYGDELEPVYRSLKLSKSSANVRIMFRREPLAITTLDSYIPLNSPMAVIQAAKAVGHLINSEDEMAEACLARAEKFITEDQSTREEGDRLATDRQTPGTIGYGITHSEGISVADVYDTACEIFGKVGRSVLLKKITQACQSLLNKGHWEGLLGYVDIWPMDQRAEINATGGKGHGYYALPRFVGTPLQINVCGFPAMPRNKWFDFNLSGTGERSTAGVHHWDDLGQFPLSNLMLREEGTGHLLPCKMVAVCENALDEGKNIRMYGLEALNGRVVEVWRGGVSGWTCPCLSAIGNPGSDAPLWVQVDKIEREETRSFVRLVQVVETVIAPILASDVTTITTGFSLVGTYGGTPSTIRAYGVIGADKITIYGDAGHTIQVGVSATITGLNPANAIAISFTVDEMTFTGTVQRTSGSLTAFVIGRTYSAGVSGSTTRATGREFGFWYPDEVEPMYRHIRLPGTHVKRIRVLYRRNFHRLVSLFDPIPLRSSLSVENMLRALKAQEMGLIQNAEPLEGKAVRLLADDRIKEGQSEMPDITFDPAFTAGGFQNIT